MKKRKILIGLGFGATQFTNGVVAQGAKPPKSSKFLAFLLQAQYYQFYI
jgi:hypothetical protein